MAPLPLGANRPWALALVAIPVWVGVLCAAVPSLLSSVEQRPLRNLQKSWLLLALLGGYVLVVVLQALFAQPQGVLFSTEDRFATRHYLLRTLVYAGAMLLSLWVLVTPRRARVALGTILVSGLLQAFVAVGLHAGGAEYQYFFESFDQGHRATGTFINPDHLAGYLELTLSAGLGLMLAMLGQGGQARRWQEHLVEVAAFMVSPKMLVRLSLVVMVIALVLTRSRMGNGAFVLSMVLVGLAVAVVSVRLRRPAMWLVASMIVVDLIVIGQWIGLDKVAQRMKGTAEASSATVAAFGLAGEAPPSQDESLMQRMQVPLAALPLVAQRPVLGWGGGSFELAFPPIKPFEVFGGWWDRAHNDYVQVAAETGLIGLLFWMGMGVATLWRAWPLLRDRQPSLNRGIGVAGLMALCCLGMHSMVDFNLQIPANALTFSVLLSLVWVAHRLPAQARHSTEGRRSRPTPSTLDDDR